jgi:peroxiredoxin
MRLYRLLNTAIVVGCAFVIAAVINVTPSWAAPVTAGDYRLVFQTPIGELPFNLNLGQQGKTWFATLNNGPEKVAAEKTTVKDDTLTLEFPSYNSSLTLTVRDGGAVDGKVVLTKSTGQTELAFAGKRDEAFRFFPTTPNKIDTLSGRWALKSVSADGKTTRDGLFEFTQKNHIIDGTAMFVNADNRFLNGEIRDGTLRLSTFDGGQGSLWVGKLAADGTLSGQVWSPLTNAVGTWSAKKDATAKLEDAYGLTYLKPGYDKFEFTFPDLDNKPVSLSDKKFKGKVTVVTIAGSWCPTCHDEAAFLSKFYDAHKAQGFEAVALMYEYSPKHEVAAVAARNFAKRYDVKYQQLIAGTADKAAASSTLPMINAVLVYPTMIIVDRKGNVRKIHTGFPGPATGVHHDEFKAEFTTLIESLLAEGA